jgi:septum formation protein
MIEFGSPKVKKATTGLSSDSMILPSMPTAISKARPLLLASGSRYRAGLLARLRVPFSVQPADADETPLPGEPPAQLAQRLARAKAQAVAQSNPERWVLGSDQVASADSDILGKPGTRERAVEQLSLLSGRSAVFYTAVALVCGEQMHEALDTTIVRFRPLTREEIERYLDAEPALDCAGSFKSEGLGISLCAAIETRDPTALVGLPLIAVRELLAQAGFPLP